MITRTERAIKMERNTFGKIVYSDLGFENTTYIVTENEFLKTELPNKKGYGAKANDLIRGLMEFKAWEEPSDCRYVIFDVVDGKINNISDVDYELYKACIYFVEIEG